MSTPTRPNIFVATPSPAAAPRGKAKLAALLAAGFAAWALYATPPQRWPGLALLAPSGCRVERPMQSAKCQSFADQGGPAEVAPRVARLRAALSDLGLAGFLIPRGDRHQNEYLAPDQERLLWATGFSGSAGLAIVL